MKKISLHIIFLFSMLNGFAQKDFAYCKAGLSLLLGEAQTSDDLTVLPALTIAPGFRIIKTKEFSLTTDFPISLGVSNKNEDFRFGVDAPALLNLNFGFTSSKQSTANLGISFGAGIGYHYCYNEYYNPYNNEEYDELSVAGYVFQTGIFFRDKFGGKGLSGGGIKISFMTNSKSAPVQKKVFGISLLATEI
ncbi:MAG TPA: hypothetical protein VFP97_06435 [Chitinophagaceae bacterium]|nr:hypothetical protein [Chitinophagaceae bacterium]